MYEAKKSCKNLGDFHLFLQLFCYTLIQYLSKIVALGFKNVYIVDICERRRLWYDCRLC